MKPDEIRKLEAYLRGKFKLDNLQVRARPKKDDSAEVYIGEEFIGVIYRDDEDDDDLSWNFQMAILQFDLEGRDLAHERADLGIRRHHAPALLQLQDAAYLSLQEED